MKHLEHAIDALREGDRERALKHLLGRWRMVPDPALAEAIERVAPPADTWLGEERIARCYAALGRPMDGVLGRVLETLPLLTASEASPVLDGLRQWPEDPRITGRLLSWFRLPPWTSLNGQKAWRRVFRLLEQRHDARLRTLLHYDPSRYFTEAMRPWIADRLDALLVRRRPAPRRLSPRESALLDMLTVITDQGGDPIEPLWRAVFEAPREDAPRLVLADALTEMGDLRGEFITLQIQGDRRAAARIQSLIQEHSKTWLGPLDGALLTRGRRFTRGFLDAAVVKPRNPSAAEAAMDHDLWTTVTTLQLRSALTGPRVFDLAMQQKTISLQELRGLLSAEQLVEVLRNAHRKPIRVLGLATDAWMQTWSVPRGRPSVHLNLRSLEIGTGALVMRGWLHNTLGRVPTVTLTTADVPSSGLLHQSPRDAVASMAELQPLARDQITLTVSPDRPVLRATCARDEDWGLRLQILRLPARPTGSHGIEALLDSLDPGRVLQLRVGERVASQLRGLARFDIELV